MEISEFLQKAKPTATSIELDNKYVFFNIQMHASVLAYFLFHFDELEGLSAWNR